MSLGKNARASADARLVPLDATNWRQALDVRTAPGQLQFVADFEPVALVILAKSYLRPGGRCWHPFGIEAKGKLVGLAALAHAEPAPECELFHLVVDADHQRQGIASAAIGCLILWIRENLPACRQLVLTVHPQNAAARRLYARAGFTPLGTERAGEPVLGITI